MRANIDKLALEVTALGPEINNLKISVKHTALNELTPASYETGLQEVYNINTNIASVGTANFNFPHPICMGRDFQSSCGALF